LKRVTGVERIKTALPTETMEKVFILVNLYYSLADHGAGSYTDRTTMRQHIQAMLRLFLETVDDSAMRPAILNVEPNKKEIDRLVKAGYDRALFEKGVEVEIEVSPLTEQTIELALKEAIRRRSEELVDIAQELHYKPDGMTDADLEALRFDNLEAAQEFVRA